MKKAIVHIKTLHLLNHGGKSPLKGKGMREDPSISDAFVEIENGRIASYGKMVDFKENGIG